MQTHVCDPNQAVAGLKMHVLICRGAQQNHTRVNAYNISQVNKSCLVKGEHSAFLRVPCVLYGSWGRHHGDHGGAHTSRGWLASKMLALAKRSRDVWYCMASSATTDSNWPSESPSCTQAHNLLNTKSHLRINQRTTLPGATSLSVYVWLRPQETTAMWLCSTWRTQAVCWNAQAAMVSHGARRQALPICRKHGTVTDTTYA